MNNIQKLFLNGKSIMTNNKSNDIGKLFEVIFTKIDEIKQIKLDTLEQLKIYANKQKIYNKKIN